MSLLIYHRAARSQLPHQYVKLLFIFDTSCDRLILSSQRGKLEPRQTAERTEHVFWMMLELAMCALTCWETNVKAKVTTGSVCLGKAVKLFTVHPLASKDGRVALFGNVVKPFYERTHVSSLLQVTHDSVVLVLLLSPCIPVQGRSISCEM
jgi:hypothetical protein